MEVLFQERPAIAVHDSPSPSRRGLFNRVVDWLYIDEGNLSISYRLIGLLGLLNAWILYGYMGIAQPYLVPAWRIGWHFVRLPILPERLMATICLVSIACCIALVFGLKKRVLFAVPALTLLYVGSLDLVFLKPHFVPLNICFLTAAIFHRGGKSFTRRLMQLTVFACYFYSATHKLLLPDFMSGASLLAFSSDKIFLRPFTIALLSSADIHWCQAAAWVVVLAEYFIAFGLLSTRLRPAALVVGVAFHAAIAIFMGDTLWVFSLAMMIGYLSFLSWPKVVDCLHPPATSLPPTKSASLLAVPCASLVLFFPLHSFPLDHANDRSTYDRAPWSFALFISRVDPISVKIQWQDERGGWHAIDPSGRSHWAQCDSDLLAMARYVFKLTPARRVRIETTERLNNHRIIRRLDWKVAAAPELALLD